MIKYFFKSRTNFSKKRLFLQTTLYTYFKIKENTSNIYRQYLRLII